ncbi:xylulokinase [Haematobacter genomosp. 1]|uniref:Xylulose kinase n=1 Tax=Haematobacter genomosp. 1 TaxID=366618 RepID=A0A212AFL2_9RHOB|nr:xylulokinase [Haematobacter genomosp. 1]OWJ80290.1 xylulokinase [Haematobacter genomosp. 1]
MFLGLDLGTSGIRALLMDESQHILGSATADLHVSRPHPGWSEQAPEDWIAAAETAIASVREAHPAEFSALKGIGLSGQMHGATLYDAADRPIRPSILWNDTRAAEEAAEMDATPAFRRITGNIVFPGFTAPKLRWIARHEPEAFARLAKVLLPKDALRLWLTGDHVSEMSDASGTSWLDIGARDWSDELLAATGLTRAHMPRLVEGTEPGGMLRDRLQRAWGIDGAVTVAGGAGDNAASAVGMGMVSEGQAFVSLGTSGVLFAANDVWRPQPESAVHAFCHALPNRWHQMGVILSAADALNWHARTSGATAGDLSAELGEVLRAPGPVTFLPYLSGERTPHNDARIRGAFTGLGHETGRAEMTQAVMEGVAFALADNLAALRSAGAEVSRVTAIGGGSRSVYWLQAIATALDIPVELPARGDFGAAFGAARLGLIAATGADPLGICTAPPVDHVIFPDAALRPAFDTARQRYRSLYPLLATL